METIINWIKANKVLAMAAGAVIALFALRKFMKPTRRRRRRTVSTGARRYLRRSSGRPRVRTKRVYTKGGKAKKPWQVKGSLAAKRHMARLRKMK